MDSYETLDLLLNEFELLTTLMCSVIVGVKCNQMNLEQKRRGNVIANGFRLINGAKTICNSLRLRKMTVNNN
jgi:hypothetical protein